MPEQIQANDILEVKFYCQSGFQGSINTRFYKVGLPPVGATHTDNDVAIRLNAVFKPLFRAVMSIDAQWRGVTVKIRTRNGFDAAAVQDINFGLNATDMCPPQVAGLISLQTGRAGRQNRGRIYVPFPGTGAVGTAGEPEAGYLTDLDLIGAALVETQVVTVGGLNIALFPVMWHPVVEPEVPLVKFITRSHFATMRTRSYLSATNRNPI